MPTIDVSRKRAVDEKLQAHRLGENEYRVYNTVKKTSYTVVKARSGVWHCECPFMTKGSHVGNNSGVCKHITRVIDKLRGCGKGLCRAGKLCASCRFEDRMLGDR